MADRKMAGGGGAGGTEGNIEIWISGGRKEFFRWNKIPLS